MIEERFSTGDSFVHGLDPRVKIIVAIIFSVVVAVSSNFSALLTALVVAVILILLAKLPMGKVFYRLLFVNGLILFLWFLLPFTFQGGYLVYCWTIGWNKRGSIVCQPDYAQI